MEGSDVPMVDGPAPNSSSTEETDATEEGETNPLEDSVETQVTAGQPSQADPGLMEVKALGSPTARAAADSAPSGSPG